jgi:hypothetical protein
VRRGYLVFRRKETMRLERRELVACTESCRRYGKWKLAGIYENGKMEPCMDSPHYDDAAEATEDYREFWSKQLQPRVLPNEN